MPPMFKDETYLAVLRMLGDTQIKYVPEGKKPGTESYIRYSKYSQAKTVAEALELGSKPQDLCNDLEKEIMKVVGGPLRDEPLDYDSIDKNVLTPTDRAISTFRVKAKLLRNKEISSNLGTEDLPSVGPRTRSRKAKEPDHKDSSATAAPLAGGEAKQLRSKSVATSPGKSGETKQPMSNDAAASPGDSGKEPHSKPGEWEHRGHHWSETPEAQSRRQAANELAETFLAEAEAGNKITDDHAFRVLKQWVFAKSRLRMNIHAYGKSTMLSDSLGVREERLCNWGVQQVSQDYPAVTRLFVRWLKDNAPRELEGHDFAYTSIHLNSGISTRRHRDQWNYGPVLVKAFGNFTGGRLFYWPGDDKQCELDSLRYDDMVPLDVKGAAQLIDGNCAHEVEAYRGERFSVVFYTHIRCAKIPSEVVAALSEVDMAVPTAKAIEAATKQSRIDMAVPTAKAIEAAAKQSRTQPSACSELRQASGAEPSKQGPNVEAQKRSLSGKEAMQRSPECKKTKRTILQDSPEKGARPPKHLESPCVKKPRTLATAFTSMQRTSASSEFKHLAQALEGMSDVTKAPLVEYFRSLVVSIEQPAQDLTFALELLGSSSVAGPEVCEEAFQKAVAKAFDAALPENEDCAEAVLEVRRSSGCVSAGAVTLQFSVQSQSFT